MVKWVPHSRAKVIELWVICVHIMSGIAGAIQGSGVPHVGKWWEQPSILLSCPGACWVSRMKEL